MVENFQIVCKGGGGRVIALRSPDYSIWRLLHVVKPSRGAAALEQHSANLAVILYDHFAIIFLSENSDLRQFN